MSDFSAALRAEITHRADYRCEYCQLSQSGQEATFHLDHVKPRASGGATTAANLALACVSCSLRKAAQEFATEPATGAEPPLFNPRSHVWAEHFRWESEIVIPLTPIGRATVAALALNRPLILPIRREEAARGRHPPVPRNP